MASGRPAPRRRAPPRPPRRPQARRPSAQRARPSTGRGRTAAAARPRGRARPSPAPCDASGPPARRLRAEATRVATSLGRLARRAAQFRGARPRQRDDQVEAVEQRTRELLAKSCQPLGGALALRARVASPAARAHVHARDELEPRRKDRPSAHSRDCDLAVFERLAQRLENGPLELGQLVQEEHSAVREGRLTRSRSRAASDDGRHRRAVMGRAKRPPVHQRPLSRQQADDGVDARDLESLVPGQLGQHPGQATRQHRLADARRPGEEEVVAARRGKLERSPRSLLSAHVGQIRNLGARIAVGRGLERRRLELSAQIPDDLGQMARGHGLDARESRLRRRLACAHQAPETGSSRSFGGGKHAGHRPQSPVERQLADRRMARQPVRRKLSRRGQDRERDREVEPRSLLAQGRRREVDRDPAHRPVELGGRDAAPDSMLRLLARAIGQAHDRKPGNAVLEVGLHLHFAGLEPYKGMGDRPSEHTRRRYGSNTHVSVPTVRRKKR